MRAYFSSKAKSTTSELSMPNSVASGSIDTVLKSPPINRV